MRKIFIDGIPVFVRDGIVNNITESQLQLALRDKKSFSDFFPGIFNIGEFDFILNKFPQHAADIIRGVFDDDQCVKLWDASISAAGAITGFIYSKTISTTC